jgi:hypothetical protein
MLNKPAPQSSGPCRAYIQERQDTNEHSAPNLRGLPKLRSISTTPPFHHTIFVDSVKLDSRFAPVQDNDHSQTLHCKFQAPLRLCKQSPLCKRAATLIVFPTPSILLPMSVALLLHRSAPQNLPSVLLPACLCFCLPSCLTRSQ